MWGIEGEWSIRFRLIDDTLRVSFRLPHARFLGRATIPQLSTLK
jgi:hypothetical protein